jgi:lysophospholipase L1-like esterase
MKVFIRDICLSAMVAGLGISLVAAPAESSKPIMVKADAPEFRYEGRIDASVKDAPVIIWQGSRVSVDFEGEQLALVFDELHGQNAFDVWIDGVNHVVPIQEGSDTRWIHFLPLGAGRHRMRLFKRTEAYVGAARFRGIVLQAGARVFAAAEPAYNLKMEFLGDSITAGACSEDGELDQWDNRTSHNAAKGWAAMTAAAFQADHRNISVSGMGICMGYVDVTADQVWDRLYPRVTSPWTGDSKTSLAHLAAAKADLSWTPDVVFVNLGENDASFSRSQKQPFPAEFVDRYVDLVKAMRRQRPSAHIVLLRGGMSGGATNTDLCRAWETVVSKLEAGDPRISHFVFGHWSTTHPRVPDNRAMADELVAWLTWQDFMQPWAVRTKAIASSSSMR